MSLPEASGQTSSFDSGSKVYLKIKALEGWMASVFEESPVGIVRSDLLFRIVYANKKAMEIFGVESWENLNILDLVPNRETMELLEEKIGNRQRGLSEEYDADVVRPSDGRRVPIKMTAMPAMDGEGKITGAVSIIRSLELEQASQFIDKCVQTAHDAQSLLKAIAEQTKRVIPFDACTVSLYSRDENHSRALYTDAPTLVDLYAMRWFKMSSVQKEWAQNKGVVIVPDAVAFVKQMKSDIEEQSINVLRRMEWLSFIRYPVIRKDKVIGSFVLSRKILNGFSEDDQKRLEGLPLNTALATALHFEEVQDLRFRLELVQDILRCDSNEKLFGLLVSKFADHYGWQCIHIFKVDEATKTFKLQAQHAELPERSLPEGYEQAIDKGVLAYVYKHRTAVNINNSRIDPHFSHLFVRVNEATLSELSIPITVGGDVRAILNIEDDRASAFAPEELEALILIIKEVEGVIERFRSERQISSSYAATPSCVWVIDREGGIKRANPSAQNLLGFSEQQMVGTCIADYFQDRALGQALVRATQPQTTEVTLVNRSGSPVCVLLGGSQLEDEFAGEKVITGRDLSGHKRVEQIQLLDQLFYEIATQVKTPLILASDWLRRFRDHPDIRSAPDLADKVLRQLQKVEITYDRLALFNRTGETIPYHPVVVNILCLLKDCIAEFPASETELVRLEAPPESIPLIMGDLYQLGFVFKSTLSYLLRFSTEGTAIRVKAALSSKWVAVTMSGPNGSLVGSGHLRRKSDESFNRTLSEMALGRSTINRFVNNHGGGAHEPLLEPGLITFRYDLPIGRSQDK
jgi:PAS domain S-box-containing protein